MKLKVIITGVTGMVGEGVLHEALLHEDVESVLVVTRKPSGVSHPKLKEIILPDFFNLSKIESQLSGYSACFFCLGVSSIGKKEDEYRHQIIFRLPFYARPHLSAILSAIGRSTGNIAKCHISILL